MFEEATTTCKGTREGGGREGGTWRERRSYRQKRGRHKSGRGKLEGEREKEKEGREGEKETERWSYRCREKGGRVNEMREGEKGEVRERWTIERRGRMN